MIAEAGVKNEETLKAKQLILAEGVVLGSEARDFDLFRKEVIPSEQEKKEKYKERILEQLNFWSDVVTSKSTIVAMAVYGQVNLPPKCTLLMVPELGNDDFKDVLFAYLQKELCGDRVEKKEFEGISLIAIFGDTLSSKKVAQIKEVFADFINPSSEG